MNAPRHTGRQRVKVGGKIVLASKTLKEKKKQSRNHQNGELLKLLFSSVALSARFSASILSASSIALPLYTRSVSYGKLA